jgi:hypothetical protein
VFSTIQVIFDNYAAINMLKALNLNFRKLSFLLGLIILFAPIISNAQSEWVEFKAFRQAAPRVFKYHTPSKFEIVNGKLNITFKMRKGFESGKFFCDCYG